MIVWKEGKVRVVYTGYKVIPTAPSSLYNCHSELLRALLQYPLHTSLEIHQSLISNRQHRKKVRSAVRNPSIDIQLRRHPRLPQHMLVDQRVIPQRIHPTNLSVKEAPKAPAHTEYVPHSLHICRRLSLMSTGPEKRTRIRRIRDRLILLEKPLHSTRI